MNVSGPSVSRNNTRTIVSVTPFRLLRNQVSRNILTLQQPIRLQRFERGNENNQSDSEKHL